MKSLREKAAVMTAEERCDVLLSLSRRIEAGLSIGCGPEEILLDDDNAIHTARMGSNMNLALWPPETIRAMCTGHLPDCGPPQLYFLLGMIAYFLYYGTDYYTRNGIRLLELEQFISRRQYVINPAEAGTILFGRAVSQLTAVDPSSRERGIKLFSAYLTDQMPEQAVIRFVYEGKVLGTHRRLLRRDEEDLVPGGRLTVNGMVFRTVSPKVWIPYRPGVHQYDVVLQSGERTDRWI